MLPCLAVSYTQLGSRMSSRGMEDADKFEAWSDRVWRPFLHDFLLTEERQLVREMWESIGRNFLVFYLRNRADSSWLPWRSRLPRFLLSAATMEASEREAKGFPRDPANQVDTRLVCGVADPLGPLCCPIREPGAEHARASRGHAWRQSLTGLERSNGVRLVSHQNICCIRITRFSIGASLFSRLLQRHWLR
jgi:hypothetical protein